MKNTFVVTLDEASTAFLEHLGIATNADAYINQLLRQEKMRQEQGYAEPMNASTKRMQSLLDETPDAAR